MGNYTPDQLKDFVQATWEGSYGNPRICKALASISILECGPKRFVSEKTGYLGGHRTTIRVGAKECGFKCKIRYYDIKSFTPYQRTLSLSRHFTILYAHYYSNLEMTCRVWNMGQKWRNDKASKYWKGVLTFSKIYDEVNPLGGEAVSRLPHKQEFVSSILTRATN